MNNNRKYGLEDNTVNFIGYSLALHKNDSYLDEPTMGFVKKMKGFARLGIVYGGTYMLRKPKCKVECDGDGKAYGVTYKGETAKGKKIVCDLSYLPDKVKKVGRVARTICIISHPILNTCDSHSVQVILPQKQLGRKSNMYLRNVQIIVDVGTSSVALMRTMLHQKENTLLLYQLKQKLTISRQNCILESNYLDLLIKKKIDTYDRYEPTNKDIDENCYISTSYDATTHFESTVTDVIAMYSRITWKELDLTVNLSVASAAANE
ncbi:hypothetical protein MKX03_030342 [Papaver bracteatum]|nr:hypothetical protein MKX03_030342 [Papaver bracteatum]